MQPLARSTLCAILLSVASAQLLVPTFEKHPASCTSRSIFPVLPATGFEPSDASWDAANQILYVIDDNGRLAAIPRHYLVAQGIEEGMGESLEDGTQVVMKKLTGEDVKIWNISEDGDMKGCAVDHEFPELVYLSVESPAEIIVFNTTSASIQHRFKIEDDFASEFIGITVDGNELKKHKKDKKKGKEDPISNNGLESLVFVPAASDDVPARLISGRRFDACTFIYEISDDRSFIEYIGTVIPPGPGRDLAAMSLFLGDIYFVYDKEYEVVRVSLTQYIAALKAPKKDSTEETFDRETDSFDPKKMLPGEMHHDMGMHMGMGSDHPHMKPEAHYGMGKGMGKKIDSSSSPEMHKQSTISGDKKKGHRKGKKWNATRFEFDIRGQEGFAFAYSGFNCALKSEGCENVGKTPVVYTVNPPSKPGLEKDILVGNFSQLQECFRV